MSGAAPGWLTLRELDERKGLPKGATFRRFRDAEPRLAEGRDYRVLHARQNADEIAALRAADRIYRTSVNVVLLSPALARRLLELEGP